MKKVKRLLAILVSATMVFSIAGCQEDKREVDEETGYGSVTVAQLGDDFEDIVSDELGVDDFETGDPSGWSNTNAYEGVFYSAKYRDCHIDCYVYDNAQEAHDKFQSMYDTFNDGMNFDVFEGEYEALMDDDNGYFVISATNVGTDVFGSRFRTADEFYAGYYYEDNTIICFIPENTMDGVEEAISTFGLPLANGDNCY